jgi:dTDP-glucose pyrophosphorylase
MATGELKQHTVSPAASVREAFDRLSGSRRGVVAVVNRGKLVGSVTDGTIRRAALADPRLEGPVGEVMSARPVTCEAGTKAADVLALLRLHRARTAIEVDAGKVVGLRSLHEVGGAGGPSPMAVLMVGGRGERLRPLTDKVPKPLLRVGGQSIVERMIRCLVDAGVTRIVLAVNYLAEQFEEQLGDGSALGAQITYQTEDKPLGTAGALSLLEEAPEGPVFVGNGDQITTMDLQALFDFHWHQASAATIVGVEHWTHISYGVLETAGHHLLRIDEKPSRRDLVSAGMYVLAPEALRLLDHGQPAGMPDLVASVVSEGQPVGVFPIIDPERWDDIGTPEEFEKVLLHFATGEVDS